MSRLVTGRSRLRSALASILAAAGAVALVSAAVLHSRPAEAAPGAAGVPSMSDAPEQAAPVPVFAYYVLSHNGGASWRRITADTPALGLYSSDSAEAMREHIRMAREAGVSAFLVSWRSTEALDRRLDLLVQEARAQDFKLGIFYSALDANRRAYPIQEVAADLAYFADHWGRDAVFDIYDTPLVIVEGTWEFTAADLALLSAQHRLAHQRTAADTGQPKPLLLLASERDVEGYQRVAGLVDGNAFYWSSGDPERREAYLPRLTGLRAAVGSGYWIAPAAPGFDASLLGGTRVIERFDGRTFEQELTGARDSGADAIGIVSWNEFVETTHIEPSARQGTRALEVLANFTGGRAPAEVQPLSVSALAVSEAPTGALTGVFTLSRVLPAATVLVLVMGMTLVAFTYGMAVRWPAREPD